MQLTNEIKKNLKNNSPTFSSCSNFKAFISSIMSHACLKQVKVMAFYFIFFMRPSHLLVPIQVEIVQNNRKKKTL